MKVLLDSLIFSLQTRGGISRYTMELLSFLNKRSNCDIKSSVFPGYSRNIYARNLPTANNIENSWIALSQNWYSIKLAKEKFDIIHTPYIHLPKRRPHRMNVMTIHDFISLESAATRRSKIKHYFLLESIKNADAFIFVSNETHKIFIERFGSKYADLPSKVIYNGICENFSRTENRTILNRFLIPNEKYILWIGPRKGYKNFIPFIKAFSKSKAKAEVSLIVVGGPDFTDEELKLTESTRIQRIADVSDLLLVELYSHASALIYPSSAEGFGLPILEAMRCGCPVICFNSGAMAEISGGFATYINELSPEEIDRTIMLVTGSYRDIVVENGLKHSSQYSWKQAAESTYEFYQSFL